MVCKLPNGSQEIRLFHVLRRNEATLRAIIQRHIAPGSTIFSDEWAAYRNIGLWPGFNYTHLTVNHQQNFVNPSNGAHTQCIEANWGHIKTKLLRSMHGTTLQLLPGHLAEYWWRQQHEARSFWDLIEMIRLYFPLE